MLLSRLLHDSNNFILLNSFMRRFLSLNILALLSLCNVCMAADPSVRFHGESVSSPESGGRAALSTLELRPQTLQPQYSIIDPTMSRPARMPLKAGDGTTLYGELTYSASMDDIENPETAIQWGLYSFPAQENTTFTKLAVHNTLCANGGGAYRKGKLHFTSYYEDMGGDLGYLYFCTMDLATYEIDRKALVADAYSSIAADMTYDPVGDMLYAVSFDPADYNLTSYILATIDIETGYATTIGNVDRMSAIACDNIGQLWGVRYSDGKLVKIDKLSASVTEVGDTDVIPIYNGSATFDLQTGKLYWTTCARATQVSALYEIDTATGKAGLISTFSDQEQVAALYVPRADDITLLNPLTGMNASFSGASTEGTLSVTAPSTDKNGNAIQGDITVAGYVDGALKFSRPVAPGATISEPVVLEQGPHTFEAVGTHPIAGRTERATLNFYVGYDGPAAVTDLAIERIDDTHARLTWTTPSVGANGGTINPSLVYYKIVRMPDAVVVNDEATGNEFVDEISSGILRPYYYQITGIYRNIEGATATSAAVEFGKPAELPYMQTFDTMDDYRTFMIYDNNKDTSRPNEGIWGWYQSKQCAAYKYHTFYAGDDYLITPGMYFDKSKSYKLKFKACSDGAPLYPERLEVVMGHGCRPADLKTVLMPPTDIIEEDFAPYEIVINIAESGNYYIGFHAVTQRGQYWLFLDDIEVSYGPSVAAPGTVTAFSARPGSEASTVDLSFTVPTVDYAGNGLTSVTSVKILRDNGLVGTVTDGVAPGKEMTWTDTSVPAGRHTYTAIAVNENGDGNPVETSCYAGLDIPSAPESVTHVTENGTDAVITWTPVTTGANGGSVGYESLTYMITDQNGNIIAKNIIGTTYTDTSIDTSAGQRSIYYFVHAANTAGIGAGTGSDFITYGEPYRDSFAESFAGGKFTTADWIMSVIVPTPYHNDFYGRFWGFEHARTDRGPRPEAQDGDNGYLIAYTDFLNVETRMISPKINVAGLNNPVLSFWFYHYYNPDTTNGYSNPNETMDVEIYADGEYKSLLSEPIKLINGNGWYRYDLLLKDAVSDKDFQIAFHTHNYISYDMHIDNITVHDVLDNDLALTDFTVPSMVSVNSTREIEVTVFNNGSLPTQDFTVELYRDGKLWKTASPSKVLAFADEETFSFSVTPDITEAGKTYSFKALVNFGADMYPSDNESGVVQCNIPSNNLPVPGNLGGDAVNGGVALYWDDPEEPSDGEVTEGFEAYDPFTISNAGEWTLTDMDNSLTYTISNSSSESGDYEYPNAGYQMAFQIFNPVMAGITSHLWVPYLGNQMAVCFDAVECDNNDWLISPQVKGGTKVTFMARSVVSNYGLEKFKFCYSTTDTETTSFTPVGDVISVPADEWTRYEFTLPDDAVYFAINCVSSDAYALLVDEVTYYSANPVILDFKGFNVYRDGVRINDEILEESNFTDTGIDPSLTYSYAVTAVYDKGESALSAPFAFNLSGLSSVTGETAKVTVIGHTLHISGADGNHVSVHSVSGVTCFSDVVADSVSIDLLGGIYVVTVGSRNIKAVVK